MESLQFWSKRLRDRTSNIAGVEERFGDDVIRFRDPDGLWLELVGGSHVPDRSVAWSGEIPGERAICGFHSATLSEHDAAATERLIEFMGFARVDAAGNRIPVPGERRRRLDRRYLERAEDPEWRPRRWDHPSYCVQDAARNLVDRRTQIGRRLRLRGGFGGGPKNGPSHMGNTSEVDD